MRFMPRGGIVVAADSVRRQVEVVFADREAHDIGLYLPGRCHLPPGFGHCHYERYPRVEMLLLQLRHPWHHRRFVCLAEPPPLHPDEVFFALVGVGVKVGDDVRAQHEIVHHRNLGLDAAEVIVDAVGESLCPDLGTHAP